MSETPPLTPGQPGPGSFGEEADGGAARVQRGGRQARFLAQSVVLEEAGTSNLVRGVILTVSVIIIAAIVWAGFTNIEEVAPASGEIVPIGQVQTIQHLEGGIISEILAKDGDLVEAGQSLMRFSPAQAETELEQVRAQEAGLILQAERLRALGAGRDPDFTIVGPEHREQIADQRAIYDGQLEALDTRVSVLDRQIDQRRAELRRLGDEEQTLTRNADILAEELQLRRKLFNEGLTSKIVYLNVKRQVNDARGALAELISERDRITEALSEARNRREEISANAREQALTELSQVTSELAQTTEALRRLEDRVERLDVRSPVKGIVKGLATHTVGGVIPAGGILMDVVPVDQELQVEARINTRDVGHVSIGQTVKVKVTTFDFARFGAVDGELLDVSASTFQDEEGSPYYRGTIRLDQAYVGGDPARNRLIPGMTVQADIQTGTKTLLEFLLKPVVSSIDAAFRER